MIKEQMVIKSILSKTILILSILLVFQACRKEESIITDSSARLNFSTDSISFDTVFTTIGSTTQNFRVYNPYKETIKISSIRLNGGTNSTFRINVDGQPGHSHQNIEIAPNDSLYIFVEATVDPNNQQNPFVISDYIEFITNGNVQNVDLVAWGQNAIYYTPTTFSRNLPDYTCLTGPCSDQVPPVNVTWTDSLPIVIYGYVVVDSLDRLTIEKNTKIYFHNNGGLWVYRGGELKVNGTIDEPVIFRGDRLEMAYEDRPGQWDRIWINEGGQNEINYAIIKNAFIGLQVEVLPFNDPPYLPSNLTLNNTIIDNCSSFGLLSSIYNIDAENVVISDCGQYNVALRGAGNYDFTHCTFSNYFSSAQRETPLFFAQNSFITATGTQLIGIPNINIYNSIIYGNLENEFQTEIINNGNINFDVQNCIIKSQQGTDDTSKYKNIIKNPPNSIFKDPNNGDFTLFETSVARNQGNLSFGNAVPIDLLGNSRTTDGLPDLGSYEFMP